MSLPGGSADGPASCPLVASAVIAAESRWTGDPSPRVELSPGLPVIAAPEGGGIPQRRLSGPRTRARQTKGSSGAFARSHRIA